MDGDTIRNALLRVGETLRLDRDVEILVVGGAAGVLTGELPAAWTTQDVDLFQCQLPSDRDAVLEAAAAVTRELSLPAGWMNEDGGLFAWTLPTDWETRRVMVGTYGRLQVYAVGRLDLVAMKFIAHRTRDLEHLVQMQVTEAELDWVRGCLDELGADDDQQRGQIEMARAYVDGWTVIDEE